MLPGELQAKYGTSNAGYNSYLSWMKDTGGRWAWWNQQASDAASQAGIGRQFSDDEMKAHGYHYAMTDWGENKWLDDSGGDHSSANPEWVKFVNDYMQKNGGAGDTPPEGAGSAAYATAHPAAPPSADTQFTPRSNLVDKITEATKASSHYAGKPDPGAGTGKIGSLSGTNPLMGTRSGLVDDIIRKTGANRRWNVSPYG